MPATSDAPTSPPGTSSPAVGASASWRTAIARWSQAAAPREACGLLLGTQQGDEVLVARALLCRNVAPALDAFALDPGEVVGAYDLAGALRLAVTGVWHSHRTAPPIPSAADRAAAWPGLVQVIVRASGGDAAISAWWIEHGGCRAAHVEP